MAGAKSTVDATLNYGARLRVRLTRAPTDDRPTLLIGSDRHLSSPPPPSHTPKPNHQTHPGIPRAALAGGALLPARLLRGPPRHPPPPRQVRHLRHYGLRPLPGACRARGVSAYLCMCVLTLVGWSALALQLVHGRVTV